MRLLRLAALVGGVVVSALANSLAVQRVLADSVEPVTLEAENASAGSCSSSDFRISNRSASESPCQRHAQGIDRDGARAGLSRCDRLAWLHHDPARFRTCHWAVAPGIRQSAGSGNCRGAGSGLPFAGIFSAYRPPSFGVGGFIDKFHSLHTYGLAVDITGIGAPGTPSALLWHEIAARHGVICPYGPHNPVEWNHCQPTQVKIIQPENPLRETVTAAGPISLEGMFEVGYSLIAVGGRNVSWRARAAGPGNPAGRSCRAIVRSCLPYSTLAVSDLISS